MAITKGSIAYYGTYTVDEASKTLSLKINGTTLANQLGMEQKRTISAISADEMKYTNPTSIAGGKIEVAWKRRSSRSHRHLLTTCDVRPEPGGHPLFRRDH